MSQMLRRLDVFPKFDSKFEVEARDRTAFGAALSVGALLVVIILIIGEVRFFLSVESRHELYVDPTSIGQRLDIHVNVTFRGVPCDLISIDAIDAFGEFQDGIERKTTKLRVSETGEILVGTPIEDLVNKQKDDNHGTSECGSCYGAEMMKGECCQTCDEVRRTYERRGWTLDINDVGIKQCASERLKHAYQMAHREGCNIAGTLSVKRVQGNLHFIPGHAFVQLGQHLHDLGGEELKHLDLTHEFHLLSFGAGFPGLINPLDGRVGVPQVTEDAPDHPSDRSAEERPDVTDLAKKQLSMGKGIPSKDHFPFGGGKFQYFVKVVPTRFERLDGTFLETNQYSVTEHYTTATTQPGTMLGGGVIPGVFVTYDLSPILVHVYESRPYQSTAHFLLQLCAIIGGIFTVAGILDAFVYHGSIHIKRKMALGKLQ